MIKSGWQDIQLGFSQWRMCLLLAWKDIRLRYRRSQLGPFWITLSMGITIYSMGFLYGNLFNVKLAHYFPLLAAGMLTWALISSLILESTGAFVEADSYLKQMKLPFSTFILRILARNFIIFFHNIIVIVPIILYFHLPVNRHILLILPGLFIIALNAYCYGMLFAMVGTRYRDVTQIIASIVQVSFFLTPVMWDPTTLSPSHQFIVKYNPFAHFIALIREPLLGRVPSDLTYWATLGLAGFGFLLVFLLFSMNRKRIIYWL